MDTFWIVCCIVLSFLARWGGATHFRGASLWWKPVIGGQQNEVEISHRVAWRLTYSASTNCSVDVIRSGKLLGPVTAGNLQCYSGCSGKVGNMNYRCLDFSVEYDWSGGERSYTYVFPTAGKFDLRWSGRGWLNTETHQDAEWSLRMLGDLVPRGDLGGRPNSSPSAAMGPVVGLQLGCEMAVRLPVMDDDGDVVRCRWPIKAADECGGVCEMLPGITLSQADCRLTFTTTPNPGYYVIAIQVEDFRSSDVTFSAPLSSVPLQFLTHVYNAQSPCVAPPEFVAPTPENGTCINIQAEGESGIEIVVRTKDEFTRISDVSTAASPGMTKGPVLPSTTDPREFSVNVTWSVTSEGERDGESVFCFSATDTTQAKTSERCIYLIAGARAPDVTGVTATEKGETLFFTFDQTVALGGSGTGITVYDKSTQRRIAVIPQGPAIRMDTEDSRIVVVTMPTEMELKGIYYIHMDQGFVNSVHSCSSGNAPVADDVSLMIFIEPPTPPPPTTKKPDPATTADPSATTANTPKDPSPVTGDDDEPNYIWIIVIVIAILLILVLIVIIVIFVRRKQRQNEEKESEERRLEHWAHLQNLRMGYDGPYKPDFNSLEVKFR